MSIPKWLIPDLPEPEWRPIPGKERLFATCQGGVRFGDIRLRPRVWKKRGFRQYYVRVGKQRFVLANLIAAAFLPARPARTHLAYRDGNPLNCAADNLYWASDSDSKIIAALQKHCKDDFVVITGGAVDYPATIAQFVTHIKSDTP
jgi:hypothetical protein